jgi:ATP-dependent DNA helicase RecG
LRQHGAVYAYLMQPVDTLPGIGEALGRRLAGRGVQYVGDLLLHLPRDYVDDREVRLVRELREVESARVTGRIVRRESRGFGRRAQVLLTIEDEGLQTLRLSFFHSPYMLKDARLAVGATISVRGRPERWRGQWQMTHPEWMPASRYVSGWRPLYGSIAGVAGPRISQWIHAALDRLPDSPSPLDAYFPAYPPLARALRLIHWVGDAGILDPAWGQAIARLRTEELQVYLALMGRKKRQAGVPAPRLAANAMVRTLMQYLPWPLTAAQRAAVRDIAGDLDSGRRMHRLLQGDVGAGKTAVAAIAAMYAVGHGYQTALMAPTEVLARQHADTLALLLKPVDVEVGLLTAGVGAKVRKAVIQALGEGRLPVVVGTHALISEDVRFARLGLAMVDEQHRFGVRQRWELAERGEGVHLLAMTATPIPRTLAMALYGDMDLSVMRGMPPGRKPVQTRVLSARSLEKLYEGMRRLLEQGARIYWIVPRIDEDEDGASVVQRAEELAAAFPHDGVQGLHGRMKSAAKHAVLDDFAAGRCRILVSTTVVEVGVNVPEARLIVIEQADRYGLAQLHQLRGRVGRSDEQGYCMLLASSEAGASAIERLGRMVSLHDGLALAEADMQLRGAGDAVGVRQSGEAGFRVMDVVRDAALIRQGQQAGCEDAVTERMIEFWRPVAEAVD